MFSDWLTKVTVKDHLLIEVTDNDLVAYPSETKIKFRQIGVTWKNTIGPVFIIIEWRKSPWKRGMITIDEGDLFWEKFQKKYNSWGRRKKNYRRVLTCGHESWIP